MARRMKWKECDVHALALTQQSYSSRHSGSESSSDTSSCGSSAVSHNSSGSSEQGGNPNDFEPLSWESQTFDPAHYGSRVRDADSDQAVWNNPNLEAAINAEQNKRNEDNEDDASDEDDASAKPSEQDLKKLTVVNLRKQGEKHDRTVFCGGNKDTAASDRDKSSLFFKIPVDKKAVGDSAYEGMPEKVLVRREGHSKETTDFINAALARQENYHSRLKSYDILRCRFRHGKSTENKMVLHKMATEMVAVIVQYDLRYRPLCETDNYI